MVDKLHFYRTGYGDQQVLLIHGWASSARMWNGIMDTMRSLATFTAVDLIGYGKSPRPVGAASLHDQVEAVAQFCEQHDYTPDILMAHSMGGMIALTLLHRYPQLARRLVLICPVVTGNYGYRSLASKLFTTPLGLALLRQSGQDIFALFQQPAIIEWLVHPLRDVSPMARRIEDDYLDVHAPTAIQGLISMTEEDTVPFLPEITLPTLVIVSSGDVTVPPAEGELAAATLPNAALVTIDNARHHPQDENPADTLPVIRRFLQPNASNDYLS